MRAGRGDHRRPHLGALLANGHGEDVADLLPERAGHGIALVRPVQADMGDMVGDIEIEGPIGHGILPAGRGAIHGGPGGAVNRLPEGQG